MNDIVIHGNYQVGNFGDLLICELIRQHVRDAYNVEPVVPWHYERRKRYSLVSHLAEFLHSAGASAAVLGGGGYLNDSRGDPLARRRLLRYAVPGKVWAWRGVPYVVVGVGAGPWLSGSSATRVRYLCSKARAVAVRDEESRDVLVREGVTGDRIEVTADIVLRLTPSDLPPSAVEHARSLTGVDRGVRKIGVHLESLRNDKQLLAEVLERIAQALGRHESVQPYWIVDSYDGLDLRQFIEQIRDARFPRLQILGKQGIWETAALLGEMDGVITSKLHVGIASWALGVPVYGFSSHPKTKRFYRQILRSEFQADATADAVSAIDGWMDDYLSGPFYDDSPRRELYQKADRNFEIIDEHLGDIVSAASRRRRRR